MAPTWTNQIRAKTMILGPVSRQPIESFTIEPECQDCAIPFPSSSPPKP